MPRISIIVAHHNDQRLEDTLLSVLENRPRDCEIIVAHDGSYSDPYHLADEVLFVETNDGASRVGKLNEALYAACAPVVHLLGEGVQVTEGWCEGPVATIQSQAVLAVAPLLETIDGRAVYAGLDPQSLAKRGLQAVKNNCVPETCAAPVLAAGFYSRRLLLGLGGILEAVDTQVADVDLALSLKQLGMTCSVDASSVVFAKNYLASPRSDAASVQDLASILAAHHQSGAGVLAGIKGASHRLVTSILDPSQWAQAVAWGIGLASNRLEVTVEERIAAWTRAQASLSASTPNSLHLFGSRSQSSVAGAQPANSGRRAA